MAGKMPKIICALLLLFVMLASLFVCSLSLGLSEKCDGVFYGTFHNSSAMSEGNKDRASLGALSLPGHRIIEDYRQEAFLKEQQFNLKCIILLLILSSICFCLWFNSYLRIGIVKKVRFRLLI